jgi:hypothetical protein
MKRLIVAGVALVSLAFAQPALANVVEVTTSVPLAEVGEGELAAAIESAVSDALSQALTNAAVVGERLYLRVLAADADGEKTLGALGLSADPKGEALPAEPAVSKEEIRI